MSGLEQAKKYTIPATLGLGPAAALFLWFNTQVDSMDVKIYKLQNSLNSANLELAAIQASRFTARDGNTLANNQSSISQQIIHIQEQLGLIAINQKELSNRLRSVEDEVNRSK